MQFCVVMAVLTTIVSVALFYAWVHITRPDPPLIIIELCIRGCGLANQMFRYAAGLGISKHRSHHKTCVLGIDFLGGLSQKAHFNSQFASHINSSIELPWCSTLIHAVDLLGLLHGWTEKFRPPHSKFQELPSLLEKTHSIYFTGCMQSFKYFQNLEHPFFTPKQQKAADRWLSERGITSVVHVRRGDKLSDGSPVAPLEYYDAAMTRLGTSRVAVCTDDIQWVQRQRIFENATISSHRDPGFDMALIAGATDAVIIGIGTFGWWGAYLSKAKQKYFYHKQYQSELEDGYNESDYIPFGIKDQGEWISI